MIDAPQLRAAGTSPAAIARHYDLGNEFFSLWLGDDLVYSCGLWDDGEDPGRDLASAQRRKLDFFAGELGVAGRRVLDIGCGWGALLARFASAHGLARGVGLTLSESQVGFARDRGLGRVDFRLQSWVDHEPDARYDAITCVEATEHLASDRLDADEKVAVYREFFGRCADWLNDGGRLGLQLICLDNVGHEGSRPGRGRASELIRVDIFPESMPASLSELVLAWESEFELIRFIDHHDHYARTFRAWGLAFRARRAAALELLGAEATRTFAGYFATGEMFFRQREHTLYRVILKKRARTKRWLVPLRPSAVAMNVDRMLPGPRDVDRGISATADGAEAGASAQAVRYHYDVSNDFYRPWLGPSMMYSSGLWRSRADTDTDTVTDDADDLDAAVRRKIDFFARRVLRGEGARVLDVGCGWGYNLQRLADAHGVAAGVGLTLSPAQVNHALAQPNRSADIRLENWIDHRPARRYDAIFSYGAFEHFARDGTSAAERVAAYRRFFARCFDWLVDEGRLGLETIAHDDAPDTVGPLGRGPLGDAVLELYPESICPHLCELVLGFEPYFEVDVLRSDAADFARTFRHWLLAFRANEATLASIVGADTTRRFRRYLVSSEVQFRTGVLTNYRFVLQRRRRPRW